MTHHLKAILNSVFFDNFFIRFIPGCKKWLLCVSHKTTISSTKSTGDNYGAEVHRWKNEILSSGKIHWYENIILFLALDYDISGNTLRKKKKCLFVTTTTEYQFPNESSNLNCVYACVC